MGSLRCFTIQQGNLLIPKQHKSKRMNKLQVIFVLALAASAANADEFTCFSHVESKCSEPGEVWTAGGCSSVHGGFLGNSNNLHRIIVDDFTDSMSYLLMASSFSTDVTQAWVQQVLHGEERQHVGQREGHDEVCPETWRKDGKWIPDSSSWRGHSAQRP